MQREPELDQRIGPSPAKAAATMQARTAERASSACLVGSKPTTCIGNGPVDHEPAQDVGFPEPWRARNRPDKPLVHSEWTSGPNLNQPPTAGSLRVTPPEREMWRRINHYEPVEDAYRRGFHQGATAALRAIASGAPPGLLAEWRRALAKWRHNRTNLRTLSPPRIEGGTTTRQQSDAA
jgi:hypothetical protein